jgi:hypothetical protein
MQGTIGRATAVLGWIDALLPLRWWWLIVIAVAVQRATIAWVPADEEWRWLRAALFLVSHCLALGPVWMNRTRWGAWIVGVGIALNMLAMAANGGFMPVSPQTRLAAGWPGDIPASALGRIVPTSKGVLLAPEDTNLYLLTDIIVIGPPVRKSVSIGDVVLVGGIVVLAGEFALEGWRRRRAMALSRPEGVRT